LRVAYLIVLVFLSGCSLFHKKAPDPPARPELIVTGAPAGSLLFVDGAQAGHPTVANNRPQVLEVAPGTHTLEVRVGDTVAYRENTYVGPGDKRVITVLSGANRT
jgi:hypothetical protein